MGGVVSVWKRVERLVGGHEEISGCGNQECAFISPGPKGWRRSRKYPAVLR